MTKFIWKVLAVIIPVILLSFLLELFISWQLDKGKRYYFQADWHDLKDHQSDILFLGNSRTWVQVNPFEVQKKFNVRCEVIAQDGQDIQMMWLKFKQYLKGNRCPKEVYLQVDPYFLYEKNHFYGFDNFRTVFFHDRVDFTPMSKREGYSELYRFVPLYAVDFHLLGKVILNKTVPPYESYEQTHGFMQLSLNWSSNWQQPDTTRINASLFSSYLDSFYVYCKKEKCKLYAIYPPQSAPSFHAVLNYNKIPEIVDSLSKQYDYPVTFINFNIDSLYNDQQLFYNHMHLNNKGVPVFMKQLIGEKKAFKSFRELSE